ncbi:MAG: DUF3380 domain-containing protein [Gammaproteobacteria bacterium]|nr:DUF3380 domain-containing protein [Gammaproteobacteria bacterium]
MLFRESYQLAREEGERITYPGWDNYWYWDDEQLTIKFDKDNSDELDQLMELFARSDAKVYKELNVVLLPDTLRKGNRGEAVKVLQKKLLDLGSVIVVDGVFGPGTERAVKVFQSRNLMLADGIVGSKTRKALESNYFVADIDIRTVEQAAKVLLCEVEAIKAVAEVESSGSGFFEDGSVAILFERHIMYRMLNSKGKDPLVWQDKYPNIVNRVPGGYQGGIREHIRLDQAKSIHEPSALESASWGTYQIMGFHWRTLGYKNVYDFVSEAKTKEGQLELFVKFIRSNRLLLEAIQTKDWEVFARIYNGPNHKDYDKKLLRAYITHKGLPR